MGYFRKLKRSDKTAGECREECEHVLTWLQNIRTPTERSRVLEKLERWAIHRELLARHEGENESPLDDCGNAIRTHETAKACRCTACTMWWCANTDGYFFCPSCRNSCTPLSDQFDGICEQCFERGNDAE